MSDIALKRFFSNKTLACIAKGSTTDFVDYVFRKYTVNPEGRQYQELIRELYNYLIRSYRTEYYYKNTLLNKLLLNRHKYKTTTVLTELPIGKAKADFVMINGKGTVYEIKTELDNLERIREQITEYYKAFDRVIVVTYESNILDVERMVPETVGIVIINKRGTIKTIREPISYFQDINKDIIFKVLRKKEFERIIVENGMNLPEVSQFDYYKECNRLLSNINIIDLQKAMLKELKKRTTIETAEKSLQAPAELRLLTYSDHRDQLHFDDLIHALGEKYGGA